MIIYLHMQHTINAGANVALSPYYGKPASILHQIFAPLGMVKHIYVDDTMDMSQVVHRIINTPGVKLAGIASIMVNCHGLPGSISLGTGLTVENVSTLSPLSAYMHPKGDIFFGSCLIASGGETAPLSGIGCLYYESSVANGITLLSEIAKKTQVKVKGAMDEQLTWELNGPILTVLPNGSYSIESGRVENQFWRGESSMDLGCR